MRTNEERKRDWWTIEAMCRRGGSFVECLGQAAARADERNLGRIKRAFPEYWAEYEATGRELEARANGMARVPPTDRHA